MTPLFKTQMLADLKVLRRLLVSPIQGGTHAERLESFYAPQAEYYDEFRERLLHGRRPLMQQLDFPKNGVWVDIGAGTGVNLRLAGNRIFGLKEVHLVDLSNSLLTVARRSAENLRLGHVHFHLQDACDFDLGDESVDLVTFSYSLTMIPDWFDALLNAKRLLKPGGVIAVTDFYVSRKYPDNGLCKHGWLKRTFWQSWFAADNVFLTGDHLAMLQRHFSPTSILECQGKVPFLPLMKVPFFVFLGAKETTGRQSKVGDDHKSTRPTPMPTPLLNQPAESERMRESWVSQART